MKPRVVLIGGGGHARVILDILTGGGEYEIAGFTSVETDEKTSTLFACPRLGTDAILPELYASGIRHAFVAIGDNHRRKQAGAQLVAFELVNAISPHAIISRHVTLGKGIAVMAGAVINAGTEVGDGAIINTNSSVDHDCVVGAFAHVAPGAALAGGVKIGEEVLIGIGARVIPGVTIGARSVVGAGAAVIGDLPARVLAAGVPAQVKKKVI